MRYALLLFIVLASIQAVGADQVTLLPNSANVSGGYRQALGENLYSANFPFSAMSTPTPIITIC